MNFLSTQHNKTQYTCGGNHSPHRFRTRSILICQDQQRDEHRLVNCGWLHRYTFASPTGSSMETRSNYSTQVIRISYTHIQHCKSMSGRQQPSSPQGSRSLNFAVAARYITKLASSTMNDLMAKLILRWCSKSLSISECSTSSSTSSEGRRAEAAERVKLEQSIAESKARVHLRLATN